MEWLEIVFTLAGGVGLLIVFYRLAFWFKWKYAEPLGDKYGALALLFSWGLFISLFYLCLRLFIFIMWGD